MTSHHWSPGGERRNRKSARRSSLKGRDEKEPSSDEHWKMFQKQRWECGHTQIPSWTELEKVALPIKLCTGRDCCSADINYGECSSVAVVVHIPIGDRCSGHMHIVVHMVGTSVTINCGERFSVTVVVHTIRESWSVAINYLECRLHCNVVHNTVGESCSLTINYSKCFYAITVVHTVGNSWSVIEQYLGNGSPSWSVNNIWGMVPRVGLSTISGEWFPVTVTLYTMWKKVVLSL